MKYVYDHERSGLKGEDLKLLDEIYKQFVRSGALLSPDKKARMMEINKRLADLQQQFGSILPKAANEAAVWVDSKDELAGLSDADLAQCQNDAQRRGGKAPYCIVITNTTQQPILASLSNRKLRQRVWEASRHRAVDLCPATWIPCKYRFNQIPPSNAHFGTSCYLLKRPACRARFDTSCAHRPVKIPVTMPETSRTGR